MKRIKGLLEQMITMWTGIAAVSVMYAGKQNSAVRPFVFVTTFIAVTKSAYACHVHRFCSRTPLFSLMILYYACCLSGMVYSFDLDTDNLNGNFPPSGSVSVLDVSAPLCPVYYVCADISTN